MRLRTEVKAKYIVQGEKCGIAQTRSIASVPIRAACQRRQRGAGKRPAVALDILQDDGERNAGSGKQSGRLDEVRVRAQRARMRGVRAEGAEHLVEFVEPGRQNRRLERCRSARTRFQLAAYPPRAQSCAEDKRKHRGGQ